MEGGTPVLILTLGLVLTAVLVVKVWSLAGLHAVDLGSMSRQWVAAYNASQPASSL